MRTRSERRSESTAGVADSPILRAAERSEPRVAPAPDAGAALALRAVEVKRSDQDSG
jgi:hypothetical protein